MRLAKAGYLGGDPDAVLAAPVSTVLKILHYEAFESDYERAYTDLNSGGAAP
jgi:hypothetical protein